MYTDHAAERERAVLVVDVTLSAIFALNHVNVVVNFFFEKLYCTALGFVACRRLASHGKSLSYRRRASGKPESTASDQLAVS